MGEKPVKSFRLSEESLKILAALTSLHTRSEASVIEWLLKEQAKRDKIKVK